MQNYRTVTAALPATKLPVVSNPVIDTIRVPAASCRSTLCDEPELRRAGKLVGGKNAGAIEKRAVVSRSVLGIQLSPVPTVMAPKIALSELP